MIIFNKKTGKEIDLLQADHFRTDELVKFDVKTYESEHDYYRDVRAFQLPFELEHAKGIIEELTSKQVDEIYRLIELEKEQAVIEYRCELDL